MNKHILSIITVVFNDAENLKKSSESINTLRDYLQDGLIEHIIWDGNSTDDTEHIIDRHFPNSIYKRGSDSGIYDAMNKGTAFARGKYLFYLNAGDEVVLTSKSEVNSFLKKLDSSKADIFIFNTIHTNISPDGKTSNWLSIANNNIDLICFGMLFSHQGCAILKQTFDDSGGYSTKYSIAGDWHFLNRLYLSSKIFEKIDITFAKTFQFGVSSELLCRTIERFNIVLAIYSKSDKFKAIKEIYSLFFAVLNNDTGVLPAITIAEQILKIAPNFDTKTLSTIKAAKNIYMNLILQGGPKIYENAMWNLPDDLLNLKCHHDLNNKRLIFLISMPRSGSTLFQRLLEGSKQIASSGEPWLCIPILSMFNDKLIDHKCNEDLIIRAHQAVEEELGLPKNFYEEGIKAYLSRIYDQILIKTKSKYYLDKTPRYVHIIHDIKGYFPDAKFICLTRNPLEVINSYATTWAKSDLKEVFNNRYFSYDFGHGFAKFIDFIINCKSDPSVFTLDYSDLLSQDSDVLSKLKKFLCVQDISYDIKHQAKAKSRLMGDPKNINKTDTIIRTNNTSPLCTAANMKNPEYLVKILNQIPKTVFDYFNVYKQDLIPSSLKPKKPNASNTVIPSNETNFIPPPPSGTGGKGTIGIAITTFNNAKTISKTLESVANQIRMPDKIIVADDCSTDNTIEAIKTFIAKFPNLPIKLVQHRNNLGISKNRDQALKALETDYVTHLDGDDLISPLKLQKELSAIESFQADVAFSDVKVVFKDSNTIQNTRFYHKKTRDELVLALINRSHPVPRDLLIRNDAYLQTGGFSATINLFEDWHHKQRLAWHSRDHSWVHSGCVGTSYNRTDPGLSKRSSDRLLIAQLRVLAMNYDIVEEIVSKKGVIDVQFLLKLSPNINLPYLHCLQGEDFKSSNFMNLLRMVNLCAQSISIEQSSSTAILNELNKLIT